MLEETFTRYFQASMIDQARTIAALQTVVARPQDGAVIDEQRADLAFIARNIGGEGRAAGNFQLTIQVPCLPAHLAGKAPE